MVFISIAYFEPVNAASTAKFKSANAFLSLFGISLPFICLPSIINCLKNRKNLRPLSLIKKVINIALNQQFADNCLGGIILLGTTCLFAAKFASSICFASLV